MLRNPSAWLTALALSSATCLLLTTSTPPGTNGTMRSRSSTVETPAAALASMLSNRPTLLNKRWAVASSKMARVAPARLSASPNPVIPTTVNSSVGPRNRILIRSPRAKSCSRAVTASTTTSPPRSGSRPDRRVNGESPDLVQLKPRVGAPVVLTALPCSSMNWA